MRPLLTLIKRRQKELTETESKLAAFILRYSEHVPSMTTRELATQAGVSDASVIRFCKSIGISSFRLFKIELMKDISKTSSQLTDPSSLENKSEPYDLFRSVTFTNKQAIDSTLASVDRRQLEAAVEALAKAERLLFYGVGGSASAAYDASYKFTRIGYQAPFSQDFHHLLSVIPYFKKTDLFIAISLSGHTTDVIELAAFAKEHGVPVVAITKSERSRLYTLADLRLCIPSIEEDSRIGTLSSRMAQMNLIDTLYLSVFHKKDNHTIAAYMKARDEATRLRKGSAVRSRGRGSAE